ncbi:hypothetical protein [Blastococcus xanthinilyticus]|uniref:Peptidase inhibitor family I36 n=1 Tax=Blastococcus xanthinilyticus TaxID=1564164 RepID=A0A5S5CXJ6_9ACTN|nr:hypothetical protein [Blastococcus xanthinilyticus]TYP88510.1 hypothetical protein BD833_104215 [Blastococcus xanthinilyticus]
MIRKMLRTAVVVGFTAVATIGVAGPAAAGECSFWGTVCGKVKNDASSQRSLQVTGDWGDKSPSTYVSSGSWSPYKDTDGYRTHSTCRTYLQGGNGWMLLSKGAWIKVYDGESAIVRVLC